MKFIKLLMNDVKLVFNLVAMTLGMWN